MPANVVGAITLCHVTMYVDSMWRTYVHVHTSVSACVHVCARVCVCVRVYASVISELNIH